MRMIRGFGHPGDSDVPAGDSHDSATWHAAYVLGSLSPTDRREYEAHLSVCPMCNQAVSELSGMPALVSEVDGGTVAAVGAGNRTAAPDAVAAAAAQRLRAADVSARYQCAGLDGANPQPALGHLYRPQLCLPGPDNRPSRPAAHCRGGP